uniref:Uncharacterized protein n=1 Tax=Arundo donax TaxID=35708 RepID=A0A0A8Z0H4_ARUDO
MVNLVYGLLASVQIIYGDFECFFDWEVSSCLHLIEEEEDFGLFAFGADSVGPSALDILETCPVVK